MDLKSTFTVRRIVITGMLAAIAILLGVTGLGFIPVPTPIGAATILHIPAIIAGILEGPIAGLIVGGIFGVYSLLQATGPADVPFRDPIVSILPRLLVGVTPYFAYRALRGMTKQIGYALAGGLLILAIILIVNLPAFAPEKPAFNYVGLTLEGDAAITAFKVIGGIVSVLAILIPAAFAYFVYKGQSESLSLGVAAIVGTLTNTILVVSALIIRGYFAADFIIPIVIPNVIFEIVIAVIITVAVIAAWKRIETGRGKSSV